MVGRPGRRDDSVQRLHAVGTDLYGRLDDPLRNGVPVGQLPGRDVERVHAFVACVGPDEDAGVGVGHRCARYAALGRVGLPDGDIRPVLQLGGVLEGRQQDAEVLGTAERLVLGLELGGEQLIGGRGVPSDQTLGERPGVVGVPVHGGVLP